MANPIDFTPSPHHRWTEDANCVGPDAPYMFPHETDTNGLAAAKAACSSCLVRDECLTQALKNGEQYGVWGGLDSGERRSLGRGQSRARARAMSKAAREVQLNTALKDLL